MASGFKRNRGGDEYVFVDGRAVRSDEVIRVDLGPSSVPGQEEAATVPGAAEVAPAAKKPSFLKRGEKKGEGSMGAALKKMDSEDAFALTADAEAGELSMQHTERLMQEDKRILRLKYLGFGVAIFAVALFGLCVDASRPGNFRAPWEALQSVATWVTLVPSMLFDQDMYIRSFNQINADMPYYAGTVTQMWNVFKFAVCGILLALSGMLYQNTFRNPIAAPSMLGVSNGINIALLVLVLQFGYTAAQYSDLYYLYSTIGGLGVLVLVILGGKWISGKGRFNVVNMILMGTIISQLLGIIVSYVQTYFMDDATWIVYSELQNATTATSVWMYITLIVGALIALVPVFLFRFKLNLISFSDEETRLLGVDPTKLRILALGCGSIMILVAQMNAGQVAMASLIIPFIVRAVFGSEFRKQLGGNIAIGAFVILTCGIIGQIVTIEGTSVGIGSVVSIVAIPLFVWMLAIRQKSWE